ncbi:MAG: hypothetical protein FJ291_30105 [Planctomycetes bacterium]|nr:hypothetical protein [Planctomycetota bacterium]
MNALKPLPSPRLLAALAALALTMLSGCAIRGDLEVYWCREVVAARWYRDTSVNQDYLIIAYRAKGRGNDIFVDWIAGKTLRDGVGLPPESWIPTVLCDKRRGGLIYLPEQAMRFVLRRPRDESAAIPKVAQPVPVVDLKPDVAEPPPLPPGTPMQVCYWPSGGPRMSRKEVLVLIRNDRGAVVERRAGLGAEFEPLWWNDPDLAHFPFEGLFLDLATLPLRFVVLVGRIATGNECWPFPPEHFCRFGVLCG